MSAIAAVVTAYRYNINILSCIYCWNCALSQGCDNVTCCAVAVRAVHLTLIKVTGNRQSVQSTMDLREACDECYLTGYLTDYLTGRGH